MIASRSGRHHARTAVLAAMLTGIATLAACSAGQITQTNGQVPPIPGVNATLGPAGQIALRNVQVAYNGPAGYPVGGTAPLIVRIFNNSTTEVKLTRVTAPGSAERVALVGRPSSTSGPAPSATPGRSATPAASASPSASAAPSGSASQSPSGGATAKPAPAPATTAPAGRTEFSITIPAGSYVLLVPGQDGYLQLVGLTSALVPGLAATVAFSFDNGVTIKLQVPVGLPTSALPRPEAAPPAHE